MASLAKVRDAKRDRRDEKLVKRRIVKKQAKMKKLEQANKLLSCHVDAS